MTFEMVNAKEGLVVNQRQRFGGGDTNHQRANETGGAGGCDRINLIITQPLTQNRLLQARLNGGLVKVKNLQRPAHARMSFRMGFPQGPRLISILLL